MLAVHFLGNGRISLDEVPQPEPRGREVVVRVRSASICGTDRENLEGPGQETIPGHENAGEVVAVDRPTWVAVGDRVAINCHVTCGCCEHCLKGDLYFCEDLRVIGFDRDGGYAEYVLVPEACCTPIPGDVSFEVGSLLVDMLGTPFRAVKRARLLPGDRVGVWGAGPIGLGALMVAKEFGAHVAILDPNDYRLDMARNLGADLALDPRHDDVREASLDWTDGRGLDVAFDCVGSQEAAHQHSSRRATLVAHQHSSRRATLVAHQALDVVKKRGTLVVVGVSYELTLNPWEHLICNELTIFGTRNFNTAEFGEMMALVRRGLPVDQVVTHRFPLDEMEAAFELFRSAACGKVLLVS